MDKLVKKGFTTRTCSTSSRSCLGLSPTGSVPRLWQDRAPGRPRFGRDRRREESTETHAYTLDEMLERLKIIDDETQRTALVLAAFTGLSLSEMRGLQWEDIRGDVLKGERSWWRTRYDQSKGASGTSASSPKCAEALLAHKEHNPKTKFVFQGRFEDPLDMATLGSKRLRADSKNTD